MLILGEAIRQYGAIYAYYGGKPLPQLKKSPHQLVEYPLTVSLEQQSQKKANQVPWILSKLPSADYRSTYFAMVF